MPCVCFVCPVSYLCCMFLFSICPQKEMTLPLYFSTLTLPSAFLFFLCPLFFLIPLPSFFPSNHSSTLHTYLQPFLPLLPHLFSLQLLLLLVLLNSFLYLAFISIPHCSPSFPLSIPPSSPYRFSSRFSFIPSPLAPCSHPRCHITNRPSFFSSLSRPLFSPPHFWAYLLSLTLNRFLRLLLTHYYQDLII